MRQQPWRLTQMGAVLTVVLPALLTGRADNPRPGGPLSPREELTTFRVPRGFHVELVACEPDVIDPVAMAFDEDGRLYVAEMRGYPNGGVATGNISSGRIKMLEDRDGDGFFETCTVYADHLRFPTGLMPWKGGLLVADAPDLVCLERPVAHGKLGTRHVLYTGFDLANIQQLLNSLQWGLDNWVHACAGGSGGTVRSAERPDLPPVILRGRGIRFHPETPGSIEPTSGGGQYGLAPDEWEQWFTATNSQHLRHIVLPDPYLRRNPLLPVGAVTLDVPDHGAACRVFRISPFEGWRVERTTRRQQGPDAARFPSTELVPGGYVTSGCSPVIYAADAFPGSYRGNAFVCDPANNLVHRDVLVPSGATFTARRGDEGCEFLASTDTWFRPVHLTLGPDGSLYVLDFYREVIETPLSLPEDIKKKLNLESRGRGRIWRVTADGASKPRRPSLRKALSEELVTHLSDPNLWWRLTAQRLLVERQDRSIEKQLGEVAKTSRVAPGRAHALWTLHGLHALEDRQIEQALKDPEAGVREQALRLAEERLPGSTRLQDAALTLADDPSPRVRFQVAFTLGALDSYRATDALARLLRRDDTDSWAQTAVLSSASRSAPALLEGLARDEEFRNAASPDRVQVLRRLAHLAGARADESVLARVLALLGNTDGSAEPWQRALLEGLGEGLQSGGHSLAHFLDQPPPSLRETAKRIRPVFEKAADVAQGEKQPTAERVAALRLLAQGPFGPLEKVAPELLAPQVSAEVQLAAVRALGRHEQARVPTLLLAPWPGYSPQVRREVAEALFARPERLAALLGALEQKKVLANQLEPARLEQLRRHPDEHLRRRALDVLAGQAAPERQKVVAAYRVALELPANRGRGKAVFKKNCATCHRLENEGVEVGPDLLSALRNKSREQLLNDILDPSREVDPRYLNYLVTTKQGRTLTGMIAAETASSLTLRRGEKEEDTLLRGEIDEIRATAKSLMPEGLEMQMSKQDVADVIAYLQAVAVK